MIESGYPYGEVFQLRLLALLLRKPQKVSGLVEARFFTNPMLIDIARELQETYKKHPHTRVARDTLGELVRQSLGPKGDEDWSAYRRMIKRIFKVKLKDIPILLEQAKEFARETRFRNALVKAERYVTAKKYERVPKLFEELQASDAAGGLNLSKWRNLPKYDDFPFEEVDWLIEDILPAGSATALSGDEGVGKTLFALALSRSLTEGLEFLGRPARVRRVLYLGLDISKVTLQSYVRAMDWKPNGYFRMLTMWTGEGKEAPMIDDPKGIALLYELAAKYQPVIIIDTLRDFFSGDENSSTDTKPVVDVVRRLRALGATIILIVHPPKSGRSMIRGTGNIPQKVDTPYLMAKEGKDVVVLTCPKKNRFGSTSFRLPMRQLWIPTPAGLRFVIKEVADWKASPKIKQREVNSDVIQYVKEHPGTNQRGIKVALKMGDRSVQEALLNAKNEGLLKVVKGTGKELCWYDAEYEVDAVGEDLGKEAAPLSKPS